MDEAARRAGRGIARAGVTTILLASCLSISGRAASAAQGGSTPWPAREGRSPKAKAGESLEEIERRVLDGINAERAANGLPPLVISTELSRIARDYSRDMAERRFFGHSDPEGRMVTYRVEHAGLARWCNIGENLGRNRGFSDPGSVVVREWMKSEGHRGNILDGRFRETGLGVWVAPDRTIYFTQIFLTRLPDGARVRE